MINVLRYFSVSNEISGNSGWKDVFLEITLDRIISSYFFEPKKYFRLLFTELKIKSDTSKG